MPRQLYPCYLLVPDLPAGTRLDFNFHYASEHGQITIGPHFRLCGPDGAAHLATLELAERAREALLPRFRKRYGSETEIRIGFCEVGGSYGLKRIEKDTTIVQARLDQNVLAPNKRPIMTP
jgi:hypothetical protein